MDLSPYVESLRHDLVRAAEAGGEDARQLAERLTAALEPSVRLALLDALSDAADEITRELAPGSVEARLRSGEPEVVGTAPAPRRARVRRDRPRAPRRAGRARGPHAVRSRRRRRRRHRPDQRSPARAA